MLRHTFVTTMLDAGVSLRDVQIAARHAEPRTTMRYDRARKNLDRHPNYILAAYMASRNVSTTVDFADECGVLPVDLAGVAYWPSVVSTRLISCLSRAISSASAACPALVSVIQVRARRPA